MVVLGDELEIDGTHGAVTVLDLQTHVREDEAIAIDMQTLSLSDDQPGIAIRIPIRASLVKRAIRRSLQLVVQDHALNATPLLLELGLDLAHHPEQTRVVPDLAGLHPAAVVHLCSGSRW